MRLDRATREPAADLEAKLSAGIYEQLFERIVGGEFAVNARLPSETELARRFDAVETRHGDVEHDDVRVETLRLGEELASVAHRTDHQVFTSQCIGRQREHRRMIIRQQHARALHGACARDGGGSDHSTSS